MFCLCFVGARRAVASQLCCAVLVTALETPTDFCCVAKSKSPNHLPLVEAVLRSSLQMSLSCVETSQRVSCGFMRSFFARDKRNTIH